MKALRLWPLAAGFALATPLIAQAPVGTPTFAQHVAPIVREQEWA